MPRASQLSSCALLMLLAASAYGAAANVVLQFSDAPLAGIPFAARFQSRFPGSAVAVGAYTDAAGTTPALNDGDKIALLKDPVTGAGIKAAQSTSANQPTLKFVNGYPVWRFNGSTTRMLMDYVAATPATIVIGALSHHTAVGRLQTFNSPFVRAQINTGNGATLTFLDAGGSQIYSNRSCANDYYVFEYAVNGASSTIYIDGFRESSGNPGSNAIASDSWIGGDSSSAMLNGDIFAIFVIPGTLSATDRTKIVSYVESINPVAEQRKWTRSGAFLSATAAWENNALQEPRPLYRGTNSWAMVYSGGWNAERLGWATSTDGIHWTKNANPIIGGGFGNEAGGARGGCLVEPTPGTLEVYYGIGFPSAWYRQTSTDNGATWGNKATVLAIASMPSGATGYGNSFMAYDSGAATWRLLIELATASGWQLYTGTSSDRTTWSTLTQVPGIATQPSSGTSSGWWAKEGNTYHLYYHAANSGVLPTEIYHATSPDFTTWTRLLGPVFPRCLEPIDSSLTAMGSHDQFDQTSDCRLINLNGTWYAYYDRVNNSSNKADLAMATYTGTLAAAQSE